MINVSANMYGVGLSLIGIAYRQVEFDSDSSTLVTDSFKQQTNRILVAESFLQAATRQASDP